MRRRNMRICTSPGWMCVSSQVQDPDFATLHPGYAAVARREAHRDATDYLHLGAHKREHHAHASDDAMPDRIELLARAYDLLHPRTDADRLHPPRSASLRRINRTLSMKIPDSVIAFVSQCGVCHHWMASLGEDYDSWNHILHVHARTKRIRRRVIGGQGRWENVKPVTFVPLNHGYDNDFDCYDTAERDPYTGEYAIQYWSPPRMLGDVRYASFAEYIESHIRAWAHGARNDIRDKVLALLG